MQKGVAWPDPRFTVNGDCVTDNLTGLVWMKSPDSTTKMWTDAITYSNNLSLCGYTDWRLPNVNELESLVNAGQADTASWLNSQGFSNVQPDYYWTSTTYAFGTNFAYVVNIYDGKMLYYGSKTISYNYTYLYYVWPVRGGQ
ncbi:MAG: DUF1566 domain-containing protein [Nitrospirae bacterium]|nr:DUF1566 domain-containing protein [Nitrospirota bacterium]